MALPDPHVSVRIPERLLKRIDELADSGAVSRSHVILLALAALAIPNGRAHRQFNEMRDAADRRKRWQRR